MAFWFFAVFSGMASWRGTTLCEPFSRLGGKMERAWNLPCQKGDTPLARSNFIFPWTREKKDGKIETTQLKAAVG